LIKGKQTKRFSCSSKKKCGNKEKKRSPSGERQGGDKPDDPLTEPPKKGVSKEEKKKRSFLQTGEGERKGSNPTKKKEESLHGARRKRVPSEREREGGRGGGKSRVKPGKEGNRWGKESGPPKRKDQKRKKISVRDESPIPRKKKGLQGGKKGEALLPQTKGRTRQSPGGERALGKEERDDPLTSQRKQITARGKKNREAHIYEERRERNQQLRRIERRGKIVFLDRGGMVKRRGIF